MDAEKKNTIGFWIVVLIFMGAVLSHEKTFVDNTNKRFDKIWSEWVDARAKIEEMLELNDKTLNELDVDGELSYWRYEDFQDEINHFEYSIEHEIYGQG